VIPTGAYCFALRLNHSAGARREAERGRPYVSGEHGRIVAQGSHWQLVALGGKYAELFELQAGYRWDMVY
jgi:hypothetical protein